MQNVNLYIEVTYKGMRPKDGRYGYLLSCQRADVLETRAGAGRLETDFQRLGLMAALDALKRMVHPAIIHIYTDCPHLVSAYLEGWLENWHTNGWKNAKGKEIANRDLWEKLYEYSQIHTIDAKFAEKHGFTKILLGEINMAAVEIGQKVHLDALETG